MNFDSLQSSAHELYLASKSIMTDGDYTLQDIQAVLQHVYGESAPSYSTLRRMKSAGAIDVALSGDSGRKAKYRYSKVVECLKLPTPSSAGAPLNGQRIHVIRAGKQSRKTTGKPWEGKTAGLLPSPSKRSGTGESVGLDELRSMVEKLQAQVGEIHKMTAQFASMARHMMLVYDAAKQATPASAPTQISKGLDIVDVARIERSLRTIEAKLDQRS